MGGGPKCLNILVFRGLNSVPGGAKKGKFCTMGEGSTIRISRVLDTCRLSLGTSLGT